MGLTGKNISFEGLLGSDELIDQLRRKADFVFVPMECGAGPRSLNMRLSFPSKLTDYTATGLPILIWGPESCSIVRWANQNNLRAEIVTAPKADCVVAALRRLERRQSRLELGRSASAIGDQFFSHLASQRVFHAELLRNESARRQAGKAAAPGG